VLVKVASMTTGALMASKPRAYPFPWCDGLYVVLPAGIRASAHLRACNVLGADPDLWYWSRAYCYPCDNTGAPGSAPIRVIRHSRASQPQAQPQAPDELSGYPDPYTTRFAGYFVAGADLPASQIEADQEERDEIAAGRGYFATDRGGVQ